VEIPCRLMYPGAVLPSKAHAGDAGFDVYNVAPAVLLRGHVTAVPLGFALELPAGSYAWVAGRGGLARDSGVAVLGGIIDATFRGEVTALLCLLGGTKELYLPPGSKVAQLLLHPAPAAVFVQVDALSPSARGDRGFGSTGKGR
jgi:dUTP pyrophosphatase